MIISQFSFQNNLALKGHRYSTSALNVGFKMHVIHGILKKKWDVALPRCRNWIQPETELTSTHGIESSFCITRKVQAFDKIWKIQLCPSQIE